MKNHISVLKNPLFGLSLIAIIFSCNYSRQQLTPEQISGVKKDVTKFTANIANDISTKGPVAWLNYFENSPAFFMASEGQIVFHNYASAQAFIQDTLVKNISKIHLQWSHIRVNPLSTQTAIIGSDFHEDITMTAGNKTIPIDGYFTGTAILNNDGWKLRDLHWSVKKH
jgi:hypothetical protein